MQSSTPFVHRLGTRAYGIDHDILTQDPWWQSLDVISRGVYITVFEICAASPDRMFFPGPENIRVKLLAELCGITIPQTLKAWKKIYRDFAYWPEKEGFYCLAIEREYWEWEGQQPTKDIFSGGSEAIQ